MAPMALIARTARTVAAGLLLIFGVSAAVVAVLSREPDGQSLSLLTVTSGSMVPAFHAGDAIVVRRADEKTRRALRPGAVITFRADGTGKLVTHRIVSVVGHPDGRVEYVTKGDANRDNDLVPVEGNEVVGTFGFLVPYGGYAVRALQDVRIPLLFLLAAFSGAWSLSLSAPDRRKSSPVMPVDTHNPPTREGTTT